MMSLLELQTNVKKIVKGQDNAVEITSTAFYKYLLKMYARDLGVYFTDPSSILLKGDSGSGKTFLIKTTCDILNLEIIEINALSISQEGWEGVSFKKLLSEGLDRISERCGYVPSGVVIFIDEFDKLIVPNIASDKTNVNRTIQTSLLKYIEDCTLALKLKNRDLIDFRLKNCFFVFAGAFSYLKDKPGKDIGFVEPIKEVQNKQKFLASLIQIGLVPELAGRIQEICELNAITAEVFKDLLDTQSFLMCKWNTILTAFDIDLKKMYLNEEVKNKLINDSLKLDLGVRGLIQCTEELITTLIKQHQDKIDLKRLNPLSTNPAKGVI